MERLTIKSEIVGGHYTLKCMCSICPNGVVDSEDGCIEYCELHDGDCGSCEVQQAFDQLAAYEDTGLTPEEIIPLIVKLEDACSWYEMSVKDLEEEIKALKADNERLHKLIDEVEALI